MKACLRIFIFLLLPFFGKAQVRADSLRKLFLSSPDDSVLYRAAIQLYDHYEESNRDSAYFYADKAVRLSRKNRKKLNEAYSLNRLAYQESNLGNYESALHHLLDAFSYAGNKENDNSYWVIDPIGGEASVRLYALSTTHHIFALLMRQTGNAEQEFFHFKEAKKIAEAINNPGRILLGGLNLGRIYLARAMLDSALYFENEAEDIARRSGRKRYLSGILYYKGSIYMAKKDTGNALHSWHESIKAGQENNNLDGIVNSYKGLTAYYLAIKHKDSSLYYAVKRLEALKKLGSVSTIDYHIGSGYENLYNAYQLRGQQDSAFKYLALAHKTNDSVTQNRIRSLAAFQSLTLSEQQRLQQVEKEKLTYRNKVRTYIMLAGIGILLLLAIIFYRNNRQKQKAKLKIEKAYDELKATQQQLIHAEKMASLGELTAGIAHEIQNPLNFVNNFSEVSSEMVDEMNTELATGNLESANEIAREIKENLKKITHHGKRADEIVKGMLQHSRNSSGQKELTDLNGLADEYLRLAFHGWRAKDNSFNAELKTEFAKDLPKASIVPQDIGRVLLNLLNNAFYAVNEKTRNEPGDYNPLVTVTTKVEGGKIQLRVTDNGNGIPKQVIDKVFQPFFTTKPTGKGTGLGLSLSYDIVKAHGGEMKVESREGSGTTFIIDLPD